MTIRTMLAATVLAQVLGACSGCSKDEAPLEAPTPASESTSLQGQKMKAPGLKGVMAQKRAAQKILSSREDGGDDAGMTTVSDAALDAKAHDGSVK